MYLNQITAHFKEKGNALACPDCEGSAEVYVYCIVLKKVIDIVPCPACDGMGAVEPGAAVALTLARFRSC